MIVFHYLCSSNINHETSKINMSSKETKKMPRELKMEAQFIFDELYISPLREERRYEVVGGGSEKPQVIEKYVERNLPGVQTTGIRIMDEFISYVAAGHSDMSAFSKERGLRISDIDSLVFMLTGMSGKEFRQRYQVRMMDELLRYTSLSPAEVGRRSGIGSANNLYLITKREFGEAPVEHRRHIRQPGDEGRYR